MSGDKGLWVPGDCLTTQTNIATAYTPQSHDSDKPIGSVRWSMLHIVMEWRRKKNFKLYVIWQYIAGFLKFPSTKISDKDIVREWEVYKKTFLTKNSFKKHRKRGKCVVNV